MTVTSGDCNTDKVKQYEAVCRAMAIIFKENPSYFAPPELENRAELGEHGRTTSSTPFL